VNGPPKESVRWIKYLPHKKRKQGNRTISNGKGEEKSLQPEATPNMKECQMCRTGKKYRNSTEGGTIIVWPANLGTPNVNISAMAQLKKNRGEGREKGGYRERGRGAKG